MPHYFEREIGELGESARRLLEEKKLVFLTKSDSLIRAFERKDLGPADCTLPHYLRNGCPNLRKK